MSITITVQQCTVIFTCWEISKHCCQQFFCRTLLISHLNIAIHLTCRPFGVEPWPFWKSLLTFLFFHWGTLLSFELRACPLLLKPSSLKAQVTVLLSWFMSGSLFRERQGDRLSNCLGFYAWTYLPHLLNQSLSHYCHFLLVHDPVFLWRLTLSTFSAFIPSSLPTKLISWNSLSDRVHLLQLPCSTFIIPTRYLSPSLTLELPFGLSKSASKQELIVPLPESHCGCWRFCCCWWTSSNFRKIQLHHLKMQGNGYVPSFVLYIVYPSDVKYSLLFGWSCFTFFCNSWWSVWRSLEAAPLTLFSFLAL